jgi:cytochrome c biogenesis protein CcdA
VRTLAGAEEVREEEMITLFFLEAVALIFMLALFTAYYFSDLYIVKRAGKRWVEGVIKVLFGLTFLAAIVLYCISLGRI